MAAGRIVLPPYFPARDRNARLVSGALLYVYANGTTTKASIYSNEALTTALANPVEANSSGQFPAIWASDAATYTLAITDADGRSIGNPSVFDDYSVTTDFDTATAAIAEAAATSAADYYADILELAGEYPDPAALATRAAKAANLSDLASAASARTNLGATAIGEAVFTAVSAAAISETLLVRPETTSQASGVDVLEAVTTGARNTGFGYLALKANTGGSENTAFGYLALTAVTGGADPVANYNTAFGSFSLASLTTGYKNSAFGRACGDNLTTGYHDTALGYGAMHWHTTALNCVGVGFEAVHGGASAVATAMQGTVGVGFQALYDCTGNFNTAVGTSAGRFITTGERSTAIGANALNQSVTGSDNVAVGYGAGQDNLGSGNIFIGAGADADGSVANVTVIGTSINGTADNTLYLGNGQTIVPGTSSGDIGTQAKPWNYGIFGNSLWAHSGTAPTAGGTAGAGILIGSGGSRGVFFGSGAPTLSAAKGSLYLRSDGSGTNDRMYVNTDSGTTWTAVVTVA